MEPKDPIDWDALAKLLAETATPPKTYIPGKAVLTPEVAAEVQRRQREAVIKAYRDSHARQPGGPSPAEIAGMTHQARPEPAPEPAAPYTPGSQGPTRRPKRTPQKQPATTIGDLASPSTAPTAPATDPNQDFLDMLGNIKAPDAPSFPRAVAPSLGQASNFEGLQLLMQLLGASGNGSSLPALGALMPRKG